MLDAPLTTLDTIFARVKAHLRSAPMASKLEENSSLLPAFAQLAAERAATRQLGGWAEAAQTARGEGSEQAQAGGAEASVEERLATVYAAELLRGLRSGVDLGPSENVPMYELGIPSAELARVYGDVLSAWCDVWSSWEAYAPLVNGTLGTLPRERRIARLGCRVQAARVLAGAPGEHDAELFALFARRVVQEAVDTCARVPGDDTAKRLLAEARSVAGLHDAGEIQPHDVARRLLAG